MIGQCGKLRIVRDLIVLFQSDHVVRHIQSVSPPSALFIPATMTPLSKLTLFATRKRKGEASGCPAPQSKHVHQWESMQTGLDTAKLRIMANHRQRKKRALNVLQATQQYKGISSAERKATEAEVIAGLEAHRDADF